MLQKWWFDFSTGCWPWVHALLSHMTACIVSCKCSLSEFHQPGGRGITGSIFSEPGWWKQQRSLVICHVHPPNRAELERFPQAPQGTWPRDRVLERPKPSKGIKLGPLPHPCVLRATGRGGSIHPEAVSPPSADGLEPEHSRGHPPGPLGLRILIV